MAKTRLKQVKEKIADSKASQKLGDESLDICVAVDHIDEKTRNKINKKSGWKYGYDPTHDVVVISKTGQIGDVVEIQNLKIALPLQPKEVYGRSAKKEVSPCKRLESLEVHPALVMSLSPGALTALMN